MPAEWVSLFLSTYLKSVPIVLAIYFMLIPAIMPLVML